MARSSRSRTQFERSVKDDKPTVREKERIKRKNTIASPEFHKWYEARVHIQPTPSDPYRAYMIDRSLRAKRFEENEWEMFVNRSDMPPVDNFRSGDDPQDDPNEPIHTPPRRRTPNYTPSTMHRPQVENEELFKKTVALKDDFTKIYGTEDVNILVEKRRGSAYHKDPYGGKATVIVPVHFYEAVKKEGHKKHVSAQYESINLHELGHGAQYGKGTYEEYRTDTAVPHSPELRAIMDRVKTRGHTGHGQHGKGRIDAEDFAHEVADDYLIRKGKGGLRGSQKLARNFAFGTYVGTEPNALKGPNAKFRWDDSLQLIRRVKDTSPRVSATPSVLSGLGFTGKRRK